MNRKVFRYNFPMETKSDLHLIYTLTGTPLGKKNADLPPRQIDFTHVPLHELQRIFHAGPGNRLLERRHVNEEKASRLQSFCSETIEPSYSWEFHARWSDGR
jgi:hypothetical protein